MMLNRRMFLGAGLGASLMAQTDPACTDQDVQRLAKQTLPAYSPPAAQDVRDFQFEDTLASARRPTWSELKARNLAAGYQATLKKAYLAMKDPQNDGGPYSLMYQGWLHWFRCPMDNSREDIHASSGFLPWHRAYLYFYERMIQALAGEPTFRLMAWDWETPGNENIPDLYNDPDLFPEKIVGCNYQRPAKVVAPGNVGAYLQQNGAPPTSRYFLGTAAGPGAASKGCHSNVHSSAGGLMSDLRDAAFDPLFFAHHGNVDRLWDVWFHRYRSLPGFFDGQTWPQSQAPWIFYDAKTKSYVRVAPQQMLHLELLGYHYTRPSIGLFEYATLSGQPNATGQVAFAADAVANSLKAVTQQLANAAALPKSSPSPLMRSLSMKILLDAARDRTLPVTARFAGLEGAKPGIYAVSLNGIPLGRFVVSEHDHSGEAFSAPLALRFSDIHTFLEALKGTPVVRVDPPAPSLSLEGFEVHYPACAQAWMDFLAPPDDPVAFHDCAKGSSSSGQ